MWFICVRPITLILYSFLFIFLKEMRFGIMCELGHAEHRKTTLTMENELTDLYWVNMYVRVWSP